MRSIPRGAPAVAPGRLTPAGGSSDDVRTPRTAFEARRVEQASEKKTTSQ